MTRPPDRRVEPDPARPSPLGPRPEVTAPNPSTAQARVVLDELARCGVRHVVVCPGSRSTALAVAADAHPGLRCHVALDERGAGYLAVGIGRATGEPAVVVVTSGTAVANLLPAVVEADHDRVPLLLLTADRPPELHGVGANQTIDQVGIFGSATRWTVDLGVAGTAAEEVARWRWTACRAHGVAAGRPVEVPAVVDLDDWRSAGPVHVDLPFREPTVPATDDGRTTGVPFRHPLEGRDDGRPWAEGETHPHVPADRVVRDLGARLAATPHGVVVVGGGGVPDPGPVGALASRLGWPLLAEPHAAIGDGGVTAVRHGTLLLGDAVVAGGHRPELVLRVGRTTVAREVGRLLAAAPAVVVVDEHGGWVDTGDPRVELVRGDPRGTLVALLDVLGPPPPGGDRAWAGRWQDADERVAATVDALLRAGPTPSEPAVARAVHGAVPAGGRLLVGSSMPIRDVDLVGARRPDVAVHANRGASGIDGTVASALGVALGTGRPTVALVGDLTLLHDATAWHLREDEGGPPADLVVVVVDNDGGGIFSFLPQREHVERFERLLATPHGVDLAHLARLHSLAYVAPADLPDAASVAAAVTAACAAGGRHLVHVRTDREENRRVHARLRAAVATALGTGPRPAPRPGPRPG